MALPFLGKLALGIGGSLLAGKTVDDPDPVPQRTQAERNRDVVVSLVGEAEADQYSGPYDPALIQRVAGMDQQARQLLSQNDLRILDQYLQGIPEGQANPEYARIQSEIAGLKAGDSVGKTFTEEDLNKEALELYPVPRGRQSDNKVQKQTKENERLRNEYITANRGRIGQSNAKRIAELETQLKNTPKTLDAIKGVKELTAEIAQSEGDIQRSQTTQDIAADVSNLETFGARTVDAARQANPEAQRLADIASERSGDFSKREQDLRNSVDAFNSVQRKLQEAGGDPKGKDFKNAYKSQKFRDSLTDGEAYYLYQAGFINADKSPKKRFDVLDFQKEARNATADIESIEAGTFSAGPTTQVGQVGSELLGSRLQPASLAERSLLNRGSRDLNATVRSASANERALQSQGLSNLTARREAASDAETGLFNRGASDIYASREAASAGERAIQNRGLAAINAEREAASQAEQALLGSGLQDIRLSREAASQAEQALLGSGLQDIRARREAASAGETALQRAGLSNINIQREAASQAERQLQQVGMSLTDLSPTEQEALISEKGRELIQSTGELSPLEQRRAIQTSRQASLARGREMGQGAVFQEMLNRQRAELDTRNEDIELGAKLLSDESVMRDRRLSTGANFLSRAEEASNMRRIALQDAKRFGAEAIVSADNLADLRADRQMNRQAQAAENLFSSERLADLRADRQLDRQTQAADNLFRSDTLADQRRDAQLDRQEFGVTALSTSDTLADIRADRQLDRQKFGADTLFDADTLADRRRDAQLDRQKFGSDMLSDAERFADQRLGRNIETRMFGADVLAMTDDMRARREDEQLNRLKLGGNLFTSGENIESNRLVNAFNAQQGTAPNISNLIFGRTSGAGTAAGNTLSGLSRMESGFGAIDPNAAANQADALYASNLGIQGYNQSAQASADASKRDIQGRTFTTILGL